MKTEYAHLLHVPKAPVTMDRENVPVKQPLNRAARRKKAAADERAQRSHLKNLRW